MALALVMFLAVSVMVWLVLMGLSVIDVIDGLILNVFLFMILNISG